MPIPRIAFSLFCLTAIAAASLAVTFVSAEEDLVFEWSTELAEPLPDEDTVKPQDAGDKEKPKASEMRFFSPGKKSTEGLQKSGVKATPTRLTPSGGKQKDPSGYVVNKSQSGKTNGNAAAADSSRKDTARALQPATVLPAGESVGTVIQTAGEVDGEFSESVADTEEQATGEFAAAAADDGFEDADLQFDAPESDDSQLFDSLEETTPAVESTPVDQSSSKVTDTRSEVVSTRMKMIDGYADSPAASSKTEADAFSSEDDASNPFGSSHDSSAKDAHDVVASSVIPVVDTSGLPDEHTGPQNPTVLVEWKHLGDMNVAQECDCALSVVNAGTSLVRNVTVEAAIPEGMRVLRATPAPRAGTASWNVGDLQPGDSKTIDMVVVPDRRGGMNLNAFVRFTGYSTSVLTVQEPMLTLKLEGSESVEVGEQATFVVRVENPGTGIARDVVIQAKVPEGLEHRSGSFLSIEVGTLNPGESRQASLNMTAVSGGEYRIAVRAVADGGLKDQSIAIIAIAQPRLEINIAGPDFEAAGATADYELTVANLGNVPSNNVRAKYRIPAEFRFVKADRGAVHRADDQTVEWFVGTLQPGESEKYQISLEAASPGETVHQAGVVSEHGKAILARHATRVNGRPELSVDVAAGTSALVTGAEAVIRVVVQNEGTVGASKVGLSCELPPGLEFTSADGPTQHIAENGMVVFRSVAEIDSNSRQMYLIKARCRRDGNHEIRVRLASASLSEPVIGGVVVNVAK